MRGTRYRSDRSISSDQCRFEQDFGRASERLRQNYTAEKPFRLCPVEPKMNEYLASA